MTTTAPINTIKVSSTSTPRKPRTQGVDRAIEGLGMALVNWSRSRSSRANVSAEEYIRLSQVDCLRQRRESYALQLTQRMGL